MEVLQYPFDSQLILRTKKKIRRELLAADVQRLHKKIAILGGSTTAEIHAILDLFLLDQGIEPEFYESEYNNYWQDVMFAEPKLTAFQPDIIYIHTTTRNINAFPQITDDEETIGHKLEEVFGNFRVMWEKIAETYHCPVIQNNFERPWYRLMGNRDVSDLRGRSNFVTRLNQKFYEFAQTHTNFYINDIDFLSACFGLEKWNDPFYWHMYKCAPALPAVPELAFNLANIIKSIYGKNKKALVLDLDNTLWGGVVGEDGADAIEIGQETSTGQLYSEFQSYIKAQKSLGIVLTVDSKNEMENALAGLNRPDSTLKPEDFLILKANWNQKDINLKEIAFELNIGTDALVFVDDNPAERHIVRSQVPDAAVPEMGEPQDYLTILDRSGFFEVTELSEDDLSRNEMYKANLQRAQQQSAFTDYRQYLLSLEMKAEIKPFSSLYMARIAQLTNKSNQFNLTTRRCTEAELTQIAADPNFITLYGKLTDKFGDNGVVSVVFGHKDADVFHIDLWLMSCRVLKRDMEFAMMDELVKCCREAGIKTIRGYYYPTKKNAMVKDFYGILNFVKTEDDKEGKSVWQFDIPDTYQLGNKVISVN
ncbi:MAG: HAD family hydrolase [Anaerolineaceae bacterium]|nr:HAD family hydrolase [Anaerolineaceae bacterium]